MSANIFVRSTSCTLFIIITCLIILYSRSSTIESTQNYTKSTRTKYCDLSLNESFGFICDSEVGWTRRKMIYLKQEGKNENTEKDFKPRNFWWQYNYEPNFSCTYEERIGRPGDGGRFYIYTRLN